MRYWRPRHGCAGDDDEVPWCCLLDFGPKFRDHGCTFALVNRVNAQENHASRDVRQDEKQALQNPYHLT
jgi:hypothetical protein